MILDVRQRRLMNGIKINPHMLRLVFLARSHFALSGRSFSRVHTISAALTQRAAALGPRAHALVLREVKPQPAVSYRAGYVTQVVHQVSTQRTVQQGVPQRGRRAKDVSCHGGDKADPGKNEPSLARL